MTDNIGHWISILDYAQQKGKSISTIRRSIKANLIKYKLEDGKYFIYTNLNRSHSLNNEQNILEENFKLKEKIIKLTHENDELKMLVKIYEERSQLSFDLPSLPELNKEH